MSKGKVYINVLDTIVQFTHVEAKLVIVEYYCISCDKIYSIDTQISPACGHIMCSKYDVHKCTTDVFGIAEVVGFRVLEKD